MWGGCAAPLPLPFSENEQRAGKFDGNYLAVSPYNVEAADGRDGELLLLLNLEGQVAQTHSSQGALHLAWGWVRGSGLRGGSSVQNGETSPGKWQEKWSIMSELFFNLRCFLGFGT